MNDELLLGIDVGTTNCKAVLFDLHGRQQAAGRAPTPTQHPQPNWAEYDPEALWETVAGVIRQALAGIDPRRVRGVAVASMAEAGVLLDAQGRARGPLISWHDRRTVPYYQRWAQAPPLDVFAITGVQAKPISGAFKLQWLRDNLPDDYHAATTWLHVADYIAFRLCGVCATDYSLAGRSMLFDLLRRCWSAELVEQTGLRGALLPELVPSGTPLGGVTAQAAAATGLAVGTLVTAGGHDHVCGAFAAGITTAGMALDSLGTAEALFLPVADLRLDQTLRQTGSSFGAHVARGLFYAMDGIYTGGAAVEWAATLFAWPRDSGSSREQMQRAADQAPPGSLGVLFLPRLAAGERGAFVGLTGAADAGVLARAVYEGLAYEWRRYLDLLEDGLGVRAATIRAIGRGTRLAVWMQIKADVLGRPIAVLDVDEGTALGAALLAGLGAGLFRDAESIDVARVQRVVAPDDARVAFYERWYREAFLPLAGALDDVHARVERLG